MRRKILQSNVWGLGHRALFWAMVLVMMSTTSVVYAQECDPNCSSADECRDKIAKCQEAWDQMEAAIAPHVDSLKKMEQDVKVFQVRIQSIEKDVAKKSAQIALGEEELSEHLSRAQTRIRQFYIRSFSHNPLVSIFASVSDLGKMLRLFAYQNAVTNEDKKAITQTAISVKEYQEKKQALESERASLAYLKEETDKRAAAVRTLVEDATDYQSELTGIIASLTAKQKAILDARGGTFTTSVGAVPLADDPTASPDYNPGFSPAFAGFSFGAYTHRKGMSQYGAKGRAEAGQGVGEILQAYYGKTPVSKDTGGTINVEGYGAIDFEGYYLYGIAEMPASFPKEALKAQAIAARSYAYRYKSEGKTICTTQSCQVFSQGKANDPPGQWKEAVDETRGQVLEDVIAYYSSTTGGYIATSGWDTVCGNQGCWTGDAYEKMASSPWFYKGWYTSSYLNTSNKCNRAHPWLTQEEFADIINAWIVRKNGSSEDAGRILPVTINSCGIAGQSGDPFSIEEMRDKANGLGGAVTSVTSVSVTYNSGGHTDSVTVSTNKGQIQINGSEFKESFNLRAPGYISLRSPLFNIEQK